MSTPALSVLDLVPVRTGQSSADAVAASLALARLADELGYVRYWYAEHHNMPSVASTTPPVLIAATAARTERIRVGSGGVMLPNHAPLVVAEQFAALEALAPGRIDLGIGRAPGSDPVISALLRASGPTSEVDRFEEHLGDIRARSISPELELKEKTSAYQASVGFGTEKLDKRGDWQAGFTWRRLERDAWPDAFTDTTWHLGGTNYKGYSVGAQYAFDTKATLGLRFTSTRNLDDGVRFLAIPGDPLSISGNLSSAPLKIDVLQLEANLRF